MLILGIETSCDETAVALYSSEQGLIGDLVYTQTEHQEYGGVVPELASRDHLKKLLPLIKGLLEKYKCKPETLSAIAYTAGPGLIGALLIGVSVAKALAFAWNIPSIPVHHMEGHLLAPLLEEEKPQFPFLALLVSGGHTQLVHVHQLGRYDLLGETIDDAAGEAFDKTAKLLGLAYPGGALLAQLAEQGVAGRFTFPRPLLKQSNLDFSFSGLKTAVAQAVGKLGSSITTQNKADIAYAFQVSVVETLVKKTERALIQTGLNQLVVAGGVGANILLRQRLKLLLESRGGKAFYPRSAYCTDNAAMIALVGCLHQQALKTNELTIEAHPRWDWLV